MERVEADLVLALKFQLLVNHGQPILFARLLELVVPLRTMTSQYLEEILNSPLQASSADQKVLLESNEKTTSSELSKSGKSKGKRTSPSGDDYEMSAQAQKQLKLDTEDGSISTDSDEEYHINHESSSSTDTPHTLTSSPTTQVPSSGIEVPPGGKLVMLSGATSSGMLVIPSVCGQSADKTDSPSGSGSEPRRIAQTSTLLTQLLKHTHVPASTTTLHTSHQAAQHGSQVRKKHAQTRTSPSIILSGQQTLPVHSMMQPLSIETGTPSTSAPSTLIQVLTAPSGVKRTNHPHSTGSTSGLLVEKGPNKSGSNSRH